jgi:hypothetical protein
MEREKVERKRAAVLLSNREILSGDRGSSSSKNMGQQQLHSHSRRKL